MMKDITGATTVVLPPVGEILEILKSDKDPDRSLVADKVTKAQSLAKKKADTFQQAIATTVAETAVDVQGKMPVTAKPNLMSPRSRANHFSVINMQSVEEPADGIAVTDTNKIADAVVMQVLEKLSQTSLAADGTGLRQRDAGIIGREVETWSLA
jgi:hypothetical protein